MKIKVSYDKKEDIFYFSINNRPAVTIELDDDILLRLDPNTREFIGLTVLFFKQFFKDLCNEKNLEFSDEFIENIKAGMKDMKEGKFLTHEEVFGKEEEMEDYIEKKVLKEYLDRCIKYWRYKLKKSKNKENGFRAECCIDVFQSVRKSILGELLPLEKEE